VSSLANLPSSFALQLFSAERDYVYTRAAGPALFGAGILNQRAGRELHVTGIM